MMPFVAGYALVFGALSTVAIVAGNSASGSLLFWTDPLDWRDIVVKLFLLPMLTAWLALDALNRMRPRRWLDFRVTARVRLFAFGTGSAAFSAALLTLALIWLEDYTPAWVLAPTCVTLATAFAFVAMPARRPGRCVHCGYDLRDGGLDGRCTECGSLDPL